ncbi:hypothetical protein DFO70_13412 [Cytobacillus firmus]|uniref:Uncharacterized protein n=2 Tax=Cytobacillus TaxID=2675230 RepID=A0A366JI75_CYTFI|nr:hypothetical protein DFO70_13412 [Cytobacillus firmus]TDX35407.1 hypothetical protein DFO72_13012 [Cytobacillus oceanisediminis]
MGCGWDAKSLRVTSDTFYRENVHREKNILVIHKYETKISVIQNRMHLIEDDRENGVLYWLL